MFLYAASSAFVPESAGLQELMRDDECSSGGCALNVLQLRSKVWGSCKTYGCNNGYVPTFTCQCHIYCAKYNNCCQDYRDVCWPSITNPPTTHPTTYPTTSPRPSSTRPLTTAPATQPLPTPALVPAQTTSDSSATWDAAAAKEGPSFRSLNGSSAPLYTFYMYRAVSNEDYAPVNVNAGTLAGVLWYLHHEVVIQAPRKFEITRILRFKVTMRATQSLWDLGMSFGSRFAFDYGQATGPFVCGRDTSRGGIKPKLCDGAFDAKILKQIRPYPDAFEWSKYGYFVGCNNLGEYPFPMDPVYYPGAKWYSLPGKCPSKKYSDKSDGCEVADTGGYCPGEIPNGNGTCTWNYEMAGNITVDEMVNISDYNAFGASGAREYDPYTDKGTRFDWWDGLKDSAKNQARVDSALRVFAEKYPDLTQAKDMTEPPCDFNFGTFYKEWYLKDPTTGPCDTPKPGSKCYGSVSWVMSEGYKLHPEWYKGLTASSTFQDIQMWLFLRGQGTCLRPC